MTGSDAVAGGPGPATLLDVLADAAGAVHRALGRMGAEDRRRPGGRPGQYALDLVADEAVVPVLAEAGLDVLSEESGRTPRSSARPAPATPPLLAVVDPVDGSTNASSGIPWFSTSICVLDGAGPLVALVVNQVSGTRYDAVRGAGARCDGAPIHPSACRSLADAVVGVSGLPAAHPGWAQFRALGAASLDICAVAAGSLDGYRVADGSSLHVWDYLGALLVLEEAGGVATELDGEELTVRGPSSRRPVVAATASLLEELAAAPV